MLAFILLCLYVCMYVCMYVCIVMYVCMYICTYVCIYERMYVSIYVCMYVCMYVCIFVSSIYRSNVSNFLHFFLSETDYNAMDFNLWKKLGTEFILKSNVNNWYTCSDGTGSLVFWKKGSINCKLLKNFTGKCGDVVPNGFNVS